MLQQLRRIILPDNARKIHERKAWLVRWSYEGLFDVAGSEIVGKDGAYDVAGEVWLSNRAALIAKYDLQPQLQDLDIVATLWNKRKSACLDELQGAYSFVVREKASKELHVIRDPVGAKTVYSTKHEHDIVCASTLRALLPYSSRRVDEVALRDYLCAAFVPGVRTMVKDVHEVRPGCIVSYPGGTARAFWTVREDYAPVETEPLEWHARRLRELLENVITEYLSDGEVGCYLSGGLDSSTVLALASKLHNRPLQSYSIHFGNETPNELEFSSLVAEHCNSKQHIIEITPKQMWDMHEEAISALDDPIGDPLTVPNLILGYAAQLHTPIILNGEGGDPCFGGPKNQPMILDQLYGNKANKTELSEKYLASFQKCATDLSRLLKPAYYKALKDIASPFDEDLMSSGHYVNKLLLINTKFKGADHILTKVNNITSAIGIQGRSPLFDRRVVDASLTIPPHHKLKGALEKAVLKEAVKDILPERILTRPKSGMMVPVQLWFRTQWNAQAKDLLLSRSTRLTRYLEKDVIKEWCNYTGDVWGRYGVKLWLVCALELWLRVNDVE